MSLVHRMIYREILLATAVVLLGFLGLFYFFDVLDELRDVGLTSPLDPRLIYSTAQAIGIVTLTMPGRLYELMPIGVLIGTVFALTRLAQSSEFTILRTSGLGPTRALRMLTLLGVLFAMGTWVIGEYIAPAANRYAQQLKSPYRGNFLLDTQAGWLREKIDGAQRVMRIQAIAPNGDLTGVQVLTFDEQQQLTRRLLAERAQPHREGWRLIGVSLTTVQENGTSLKHEALNEMAFATGITGEMVANALVIPERMSTLELWTYAQHLDANGQDGRRFEILFWRKIYYPLSCWVMVLMALPFAYMHFRNQGQSSLVFVGVILGISFFLLNNIFGYIGNLREWAPWLASAIPSLLYTALSLGAFMWLVLKH